MRVTMCTPLALSCLSKTLRAWGEHQGERAFDGRRQGQKNSPSHEVENPELEMDVPLRVCSGREASWPKDRYWHLNSWP